MTLAPTSDAAFGVYIHWPFCLSKCPYCDFNSHVRHAAIDEPRFLAAFTREIATTAERIPGRTVSSVFFGGGTPSLMQPATVGAILDAIARHWRLTPGAEVTLEANPTSVEATRFRGYRAAGRQSRVARRAGARRRGARGARPPAFGRRSARRRRHRARARSGATRSISSTPGPARRRRPGAPSSSGPSAKPATISRSTSSPSSRRRRSRRCMPPASCRFPTTTPRARSTTRPRRCCAAARPARLRGLEPRPSGRRMPAQPGLLARA